jgi:hypothetical protein
MRKSYAWRVSLQTRLTDVKVLGSLVVFLLFYLGLIASWSHGTEGKQGTNASNVCQKEQTERHTRPYNNYALFIAGIHNAQSSLAAAESNPAWGQFARSFDESWKEFEVTRLKPVKEWAARELSTVESTRYTVFYPFSGADFAHMYSVFPEARGYVMISLERVGRIPDFSTMSNANLDSFFAGVQRSNQDLLHRSYFITRNLETALQEKGMEGILPLLLLFMAREKVRVIDVQHWFMNPGGTIVETPALERFTFEKGSIPGVRIVFQREGYERTQTLYYLRFDLAKGSFGRNEKFVSFLKSFGPLVTFEKASSYLMFDPDFSAIRQFILERSMHILQTDSGIPIKFFDPSIWNLKLFGTYEKPLPVFSYRYQKDLAEIYQETKNIPPISFAIGYHYRPGTANLLFATRKEASPPGDLK